MSDCCSTQKQDSTDCHSPRRVDWLWRGALFIFPLVYALSWMTSLWDLPIPFVRALHEVQMMTGQVVPGLVLGFALSVLIGRLPQSWVNRAIARDVGLVRGLLMAVFWGFFFDLCNHGVLLLAVRLYRRGFSLPQVVAFLVATPWNSFSLLLMMFGLFGTFWTLTFTLSSLVIAFAAGLLLALAMRVGIFPRSLSFSSHQQELNSEASSLIKERSTWKDSWQSSWSDSRIVLKWAMIGLLLGGLLQVFLDEAAFAYAFDRTWRGMGSTLLLATLLEVCSEGLLPIAGAIYQNAHAAGNAFLFLMAGVATDYTEFLILREATSSWKTPLAMLLAVLPLVILFAFVFNAL